MGTLTGCQFGLNVRKDGRGIELDVELPEPEHKDIKRAREVIGEIFKTSFTHTRRCPHCQLRMGRQQSGLPCLA